MTYIFCDIVGVLHDNHNIFNRVLEKLAYFKQNNIKVILLSNTPRRASKVAEVLKSFGITDDYYFKIVTSGEVFFHTMKNIKKNAYFIGFKKDFDYMDGSSVQLQKNSQGCDFAIISGFRNRGDDIHTVVNDLNQMKELSMKAYCINPDLHVVKQDGTIDILCAGSIAREYENIGGEVEYFGKPYNNIYQYAWNLIDNPPKDQIVAIGDSMNTDILGAYHFGIRSILVNSGIHKNNLDTNLYTVQPDIIIQSFHEIVI
jgi:HAD superfamily hydrolase (TIGR01459 family)